MLVAPLIEAGDGHDGFPLAVKVMRLPIIQVRVARFGARARNADWAMEDLRGKARGFLRESGKNI